jgi:hypothetical protein
VFSSEFEQQLANNLVELQKRFYGLSLEEVRSLAFEVAVRSNIEHPFKVNERPGRGG